MRETHNEITLPERLSQNRARKLDFPYSFQRELTDRRTSRSAIVAGLCGLVFRAQKYNRTGREAEMERTTVVVTAEAALTVAGGARIPHKHSPLSRRQVELGLTWTP